MLVPTIQTTCSSEELCQSLILAWQKLFNVIPSKQSICTIMAQHQLETGNNRCWNWNLCNIKYVASNGDVDYCALNGVWEIINGNKVELPANNPGSWFRSFPTLNDGCVFYLDFVSGKRYKNAWNAVVQGNPNQFAHLLKVAGYYTADEQQYTSLINYFFNKFMKDTSYEQALAKLTTIVDTVANNGADPTANQVPVQSNMTLEVLGTDPAPTPAPVPDTAPISESTSVSTTDSVTNTSLKSKNIIYYISNILFSILNIFKK